MELVLLGTGAPPPFPKTSGQADGIVLGDKLYLVDAGRNVPRQITAAGFKVPQVDHLFFTHFHSDHYTGFGDFFITRWILGAKTPLRVYGPAPVTQIVERMLAYYEYDIEVRVAEGRPRHGCEIETRVLAPGDALEVDGIKIRVDHTTHHGNVADMLSYRFEADGRAIVLASDGGPTEKLVPFAQGADVLVMHPCIASEIVEKMGQTPEQAKIIAAHHASPEEVGKTAAAAGVKTVAMSHILPPMAARDALCAEVAKHFGGEVIAGEDLQRL
ncbi:MAG: MBL fold metallo-hydrolase [bacterium]|nr:MBL fold metallo-hydrolase [bacterium]